MSASRQVISGPSVWVGSEISGNTSWAFHLSESHRAHIVEATRAAISRGCSVASIERDDFPLPLLGDLIADWTHQIADGRGFVLLRGFPIDLLSATETEVAYAGLGTHLGRRVGQNKSGDLLTHIRDEKVPTELGKPVRLYRTNDRQDFHTDGADIIGLLCLSQSLRGGESRIVSSAALFNEMLRRRPDLVEVLYQPMCWDRQGEELPGEQPWFMLPPINDVNGTPRFFYIGWYIRNAQRHPEVPRLTASQIEAMELVEQIANDPHFHVEMSFEPGDIQLLNNGTILHAREAYTDGDTPDTQRHLLRLWLAAHDFTSVVDGLRAGINTNRS